MRKKVSAYLFCVIIICSSCQHRTRSNSHELVSLQIIDRNGFSETISSKERLGSYKEVNFLTSQPYQKVLRVYGKNEEGKSPSNLVTYHPNGKTWQYLEVMDGRAHGTYRQWHENGTLHLDITVIDGVPDTSEIAQKTWLFDLKSHVFDEEGNLIAEIHYENGILNQPSLYFYSSGQLKKRIPYAKGEIDGMLEVFNEKGELIEKQLYEKGMQQGLSTGYWKPDLIQYKEKYEHNLLKEGVYYDQEGTIISKIVSGNGFKTVFDDQSIHASHEFREGVPEGLVKIYHSSGEVLNTFKVKDGMKNGEEFVYYPKRESEDKPAPKMMVFWQNDMIQGQVKTWYLSGIQESSKEMNQNKKQGLSFVWYADGSLMMLEEYDSDALIKGSYYEKGIKYPVTKIESGAGIATLFDEEGHYLKKIKYEKGNPLPDQS